MIVIIPAYQPDKNLLKLIKEIKRVTDYKIIVVNDGSDETKQEIFSIAAKDATVLSHCINKGKGKAIKTALQFIWENDRDETGVIMMDADGQHTLQDMLAVSKKLQTFPESFILGIREFHHEVPLRSRFGNQLTRMVFGLTSGTFVKDTQTGLRAFSIQHIPTFLTIEGNRYEYEMNMLLACTKKQIDIVEVPIQTVYIEKNASSHFRPIIDSIRIYKVILTFASSSFIGFLIDYSCFLLFYTWSSKLGLTAALILSNLGARAISSTVNYTINRKFVFRSTGSIPVSATKYFSLAVVILVMNTLLLEFLSVVWGIHSNLSKLLVEALLFIVSFSIQRLFVFNHAAAVKKKGIEKNG